VQGERAGWLALQGLRGHPGARPAPFGRGDPLPARALAFAVGRDGAGGVAGGDRRRLRAGAATLRAGAACAGAGDDGTAHGTAERDRGRDLQAPGGAAAGRAARRLRDRDQDVLRAGLATARWVSVDDTAARHARKDGITTQIGDDRFTVFRTGTSKSRETFLSLLRAGHADYVVNAAALEYMRGHSLSGQVVAQLDAHPAKRFADTSAWAVHLARLGIDTLEVTPDPVRVATEGALWGAVCHHGLLTPDATLGAAGTVIVSDDAGQFRVGLHALCWVHAERLVHKLVPATPEQRRAVELVRTLIWWLYADLKAWKLDPCPRRAAALRARFDRIFKRKTDYVTLDRLLARLHRRKHELLRVLQHPEIPLHTNGSENDIRACVADSNAFRPPIPISNRPSF